MTSPVDRQTRRAQRRRQAILQAAARVFSAKGFDRATTREIAAEADIAEGTIYRYFGSKHDLLMSIVAQVAPNLLGENLAFAGVDASREEFVRNFQHLLTYVTENRDMLTILAAEMWRDRQIVEEWVVVGGQEVLDRAAAKVAELAESGELRDIDPRLAAQLLLSAGLGLMLAILLGTMDLPTEEDRRGMAASMVDLLMYGMWRREPGQGGGGGAGDGVAEGEVSA